LIKEIKATRWVMFYKVGLLTTEGVKYIIEQDKEAEKKSSQRNRIVDTKLTYAV
jgi:hypothetical protein